MKKKKLIYIISNIDKALAFEWIASSEKLNKMFELRFVLLNAYEGYLYQFLVSKGHAVKWMHYEGKKDLPIIMLKLYKYLFQEKADIVHTHLFDANLAGLLSAKLAGIPIRVYTRHHSTLHHVYFPRAVYYDMFINKLATTIIAISENVKQVLVKKEKVSNQKVMLLHHGFQLKYFSEVTNERIADVVSRNNITTPAFPKVGVIARYTHWKGIQYIIKAFSLILEKYPQAQLILANAKGDYSLEIKSLLQTLPQHAYTEIAFEQDIPALYKSFDVYVHTPIDEHSEAFGQTYVEALAAGVPSVVTLSGVASEFIVNRKNALVVPFKDTKAIATAILELLENPDLRQKLIANGYASVGPALSLDGMINKLAEVYSR